MYNISSWKMIFTWYPNDYWRKRKINNFDPYNVFLAIAVNIPMLCDAKHSHAGFVVRGHILEWFLKDCLKAKTGVMILKFWSFVIAGIHDIFPYFKRKNG